MKNLLRWLSHIFFNKKELKFVFVREFPKKIKDNHVYIEGVFETREFWYAKFKCPCGCGDPLTLNLMIEDPPSWKLNLSKKNSVTPSIRRRAKCESHFWIIDSKVVWCKD